MDIHVSKGHYRCVETDSAVYMYHIDYIVHTCTYM